MPARRHEAEWASSQWLVPLGQGPLARASGSPSDCPFTASHLLDVFTDQVTAIQGAVELAASALHAHTVSVVSRDCLVVCSRPPGAHTRRRQDTGWKPGARRNGARPLHRIVIPIGIETAVTLDVERRGDEFTSDEVSLLTRIARSLLPTIVVVRASERERLLRAAYDTQRQATSSVTAKLEKQQSLLHQLLRIQRLISSSAPLQSILDEIVSAATALIGDEAGNIRFQDPEHPDRLILAGRVSDPSAGIAKIDWIRPGEGATGRAFSEERLIVVEDYAHSGGTNPAYAKSKLDACMAAPVRQSGRVIGVIAVATQKEGRSYSVEEQEILLAFAEHASLALTDAQRVSAVEHMAFHDMLTGLPNRAQFMERLTQGLERARRDPASRLAVLFIDLDNFKLVNDSLGHSAGDALLEEVGSRIAAGIRTEDVAARLGGDEFAVLVEDANRERPVADIVARLLAILNAPIRIAGHTIPITASIGTAISDGSQDAGELLRNADLAMYTAKAQGRHRATAYEASMHSDALARFSREEELRDAVSAGEFELHYQLIVALKSAEPRGVEALVRWRHPTRGLVLPSEFVPLAEETGLILPLGGWVLDEATRHAAAWQRQFGWPELMLAVNLSARQLDQTDFVDEVRNAVTSAGIDPRTLTLEITESAILEDSASLRHRLLALKALGVRLALDDFGTGFSSLSHLRQLPIDVLKIDRVFINDLGSGSGRDGAAMIAAIVGLSTALHLEVVAEGIEHETQASELRRLKCLLGQGYLFGRPMNAAAMGDLLGARRRTAPLGRHAGGRHPRRSWSAA